MRSSIVAQAAIALLASSAAALQLPSLSSLLKREVAPGTPLYSCHEACGQSGIFTYPSHVFYLGHGTDL